METFICDDCIYLDNDIDDSPCNQCGPDRNWIKFTVVVDLLDEEDSGENAMPDFDDIIDEQIESGERFPDGTINRH